VHEVKNARPEVIGIHIAAKPGGRGITTADLRSFALDELTTDVFTVVGVPMFDADAFAAAPQDYPEKDHRHIGRTMREARQGSRGKVTRAELEEVARVYREHIDTTPIQAVRSARGYKRTAPQRGAYSRPARPGFCPRRRLASGRLERKRGTSSTVSGSPWRCGRVRAAAVVAPLRPSAHDLVSC
jgi:hypothetical protein